MLSLFICIFLYCFKRPLNGCCCCCCCSCTVLFVSISQVICCEDHLRNDLYCVEWGVKLYSSQPAIAALCSSVVLLGFHSTCHNPVINNTVIVNDSVTRWQCRVCSYRQTASPVSKFVRICFCVNKLLAACEFYGCFIVYFCRIFIVNK